MAMQGDKENNVAIFNFEITGNASHRAVRLHEDLSRTNSYRLTKEPARYPCSKCGKKFTRSATLRDHERAHNNDRPFKCNSCNKSFARLKDRERHQKLHTEEKQFTCWGALDGVTWGCGRKFAREDGLFAHFRSLNGMRCIEPFNSKRTNTESQTCRILRTRPPVMCETNSDSARHASKSFSSGVEET